MKILLVYLFAFAVVLGSCKKLEEFEGNNVEFEKTEFEFTETMTFRIPNTVFTMPLSICWSIPLTTVDFNEMVPAENPNPYAHLVKHIIPKSIKMELVGVEACDLAMLDEVQVFMVDSSVTNMGDIIFFDPNNPTAEYNAKKMGEYFNADNGTNKIPDDIGNIMYLEPDQDIELDEFIHDQKFNVYMMATIDKTFVEDYATIKTTLDLDVTLINEE